MDQWVNEAQLVMNLGVRDYYDRVVAESRQSVETHRGSRPRPTPCVSGRHSRRKD
jgi:hypothetical protein